MKIFFIIALLGPSLLMGQSFSFIHDGNPRSYIVHLPTGYTPANQYPLVFNFHGYTSTGAQQQGYSQMDQVADTAGFIVVYPDGIGNAWNVGFGFAAYFTGVDDVGFTNALLDTLIAHYSVNTNAVFATGMSNGGFFSQRLACELPHRIAAIASVTGTLTDSTRFYCAPPRNVPVMHIHGTSDPIVNYNGGAQTNSVVEMISFWTNHNGCPGSSADVPFTDINTSDNCTALKKTYSPCSDHAKVVLIEINNGGHTWPGASIDINLYGNTNRDFNASGEIWNFFRPYRLNEFIGIEQVETPWINIHPNPAHHDLYISPGVEYIIYNTRGKIMKQGISDDSPVDVSEFTIGMYFAQLKTAKITVVRKFLKI